ncbi:hypothetical protein PG996_009026 [Apiospora saccharicola]|uniref:Uncharacterized protein n=1 Tax=Apiospora saccharicola TaxID=335842 RepID=A0ABR1UJK6_9PEZI
MWQSLTTSFANLGVIELSPRRLNRLPIVLLVVINTSIVTCRSKTSHFMVMVGSQPDQGPYNDKSSKPNADTHGYGYR